MGLQPKIQKKTNFTIKQCNRCKQNFGPENFAPTRSIFYPDKVLPICNDCIDRYIEGDLELNPDDQGSWRRVDKLCQLGDIPFVPREWYNIYEMNPINAFARYAIIFQTSEYEGLGWQDYFEAFKKLKEEGRIHTELPIINEQILAEKRARWGPQYDVEALDYLESLFTGLMGTQNVTGALQTDQAYKICKLSWEVDRRIAGGEDFDKTLAAYDKLVKIAEFTPKNVKNVNGFDSAGEIIKWMEKKGWRNKYYDNVTRDIVDETIKNFQSFNQRLYTNESGIGDDITHRIQMLKSLSEGSKEQEGYYLDEKVSCDLDKYENDGYEELLKDQAFDPNA